MMKTSPDTLKATLKSQSIDGPLGTRLHRAVSWLACATDSESDDLRFISLWIAFSACMGVADEQHTKLGERALFQLFIQRLVSRDEQRLVENVIWETYPNAVASLLENPYVMREFWEHQRISNPQWDSLLTRQRLRASRYFQERSGAKILGLVLDRLSVLRNQIMFGGATFKSSVNRSQVAEGTLLLQELVPAVIEVMMYSANDDWGEIYYPVMSQPH
ncbi:hypothetical protein [Umboniibacter marinipuniceus]|uniref:Apea-like HEPN domain-containing protein n=1 Tax=Umboniibacter marinipuniceus TaxID=569599 RepID=A0A3M0A4E3_9GAMM|nr:hypothetical protein [Umboniibacter marinipuniceus]RMA77648.1 hypothetical protein DFR27_2468 [Umboniibacter marinipuniceus]